MFMPVRALMTADPPSSSMPAIKVLHQLQHAAGNTWRWLSWVTLRARELAYQQKLLKSRPASSPVTMMLVRKQKNRKTMCAAVPQRARTILEWQAQLEVETSVLWRSAMARHESAIQLTARMTASDTDANVRGADTSQMGEGA